MGRYEKVILLGNGHRPGVMDAIGQVRSQIEDLFEVSAADFSGVRDLSDVSADFAIAFGGDGSLLRAVHQLGAHQVPFLAVHLGTLGFLSTVAADDLVPLLKSEEFQNLSIRRQILLECLVYKKDCPNESEPVKKLVVNETALRGGPPFEILKIELAVDGESVTTCHGDGVIISTPVGSTAHSLSAGGPILRRELNDVVISTLNPHTLSNRPVIDSAERTYELFVVSREAWVVVDGEVCTSIVPGDRVVIRKAPFTFDMFRTNGRSYYRTLREKLGWSGHAEGLAQNR